MNYPRRNSILLEKKERTVTVDKKKQVMRKQKKSYQSRFPVRPSLFQLQMLNVSQ